MNIRSPQGMMFPLLLMIVTLVFPPKMLSHKTQCLTLTVQKCLFLGREMMQFTNILYLLGLMSLLHPMTVILVLPLKKPLHKDQHLTMMEPRCLLWEGLEMMSMNTLYLLGLMYPPHPLSIVLILVRKIPHLMVQYLTVMELKCLLLAIPAMILTNIYSLQVLMYQLLPLLETLASLRKTLLREV